MIGKHEVLAIFDLNGVLCKSQGSFISLRKCAFGKPYYEHRQPLFNLAVLYTHIHKQQ